MIFDTIKTSTKFAPFTLLLNPWFWLAIVAWTVLVACYAADWAGDNARVEQIQMTVQAMAEQKKAADKVLAKERQLRTDDRRSFDQFKKEHDDAKKDADRVIADLRRDNLRLRVPVRAIYPATTDGSRSTAAGTGSEGHAELAPDAAEFVASLLTRGDSAIRKHAEVVDRYERLRGACMKREPISNSPVLP